jgi:ABC-type microcin C transport system permease subunit YejE
VGSFERTSSVNAALRSSPAFLAELGVGGLIGRNGLPEALQGITNDQAAVLSASISTLFSTIQALGSESDDTAPALGSLLDITA